MLLNRNLFFVLTALFLMSCSPGNRQKETSKSNKTYARFPSGKVLPKVVIRSDTTLSYALYLPAGYDVKKENKIIFIFDAHARGTLPLEKYKTLADQYNLILAASNNSKNGQSGRVRNHIISAFMGDVEERIHIDENKIYTAGFSGGARIATLVALYNGNVAGVVGCAAGFPQVQNPVNKSFIWVGVVGNKDFNFLELVNLNRQLKANRWKSFLLTFDGKHQWPPVEVMSDAIKMMLNGAQKSQYTFSQATLSDGLENKEIEQQRILVRAMEEKDTLWWRKKVSVLQQQATMAKSKNEKLVNERLLSYLSMISYIYTDKAIKNHNIHQAEKFLTIYKLADFTNHDRYYLTAVWYAQQNKNEKALQALQKAVDLGFNDKAALLSEKAFIHLQDTPAFKNIVQQLKTD